MAVLCEHLSGSPTVANAGASRHDRVGLSASLYIGHEHDGPYITLISKGSSI